MAWLQYFCRKPAYPKKSKTKTTTGTVIAGDLPPCICQIPRRKFTGEADHPQKFPQHGTPTGKREREICRGILRFPVYPHLLQYHSFWLGLKPFYCSMVASEKVLSWAPFTNMNMSHNIYPTLHLYQGKSCWYNKSRTTFTACINPSSVFPGLCRPPYVISSDAAAQHLRYLKSHLHEPEKYLTNPCWTLSCRCWTATDTCGQAESLAICVTHHSSWHAAMLYGQTRSFDTLATKRQRPQKGSWTL